MKLSDKNKALLRNTLLFKKKVPWWIKLLRAGTVGTLMILGLQHLVLPNLPGRGLTPGEVKMLTPIFKNSVDYSRVRIHQSFVSDAMRKVFRAGAITFGSTILEDDRTPDYSAPGVPFWQSYKFTHEMTHVWQNQNGVHDDPVRTAERFFAKLNPWDKQFPTYVYRLKDGRDLTDFTVEQQASIVPDYNFVVKAADAAKKDVQSPLDADKFASPGERKAAYESTLKNFLKNPSYPRHR